MDEPRRSPLDGLHEVVDAELELAGSDHDDDPDSEEYRTRLLGLHDAVVEMQAYEADREAPPLGP